MNNGRRKEKPICQPLHSEWQSGGEFLLSLEAKSFFGGYGEVCSKKSPPRS